MRALGSSRRGLARFGLRRAYVALACLLPLIALGCQRGCRREVKPATEGPQGTRPADLPSVPGTGERVREVGLTGRDFRMDGTLLPGPVRFHVRNLTNDTHSFAIESAGRSTQLPDSVPPGEVADFNLMLEAGTYRVYCPLHEHGTEKARMLVVTPRATS